MSNKFSLPKKGFVFSPVGTGDSTTVVVKENNVVFQLDLHHLDKADDSEETAWPIIDELVRLLPKKDGKPYLSVFALTHPDEDHIRGFSDLLKKVKIGEIWHTPRILTEYKKDLCNDAKVFAKEAERRIKEIIKSPNDVKAGDRIRIIGFDDILKEDDYKGFPKDRLSVPGTTVNMLDNIDVSDSFEAFVHAPFKDDSAGPRNNTSLSVHITLKEGKQVGQGFFFGDREYPTVKQIFETTEENKKTQYLSWDILLSPHHCSKKVMYWKDEEDKDETFRQDIMDYFEKYEKADAHIVTSARAEFTDGNGDNPPHSKARKQYEKIIDAGHFLCTHEQPSEEAPEPLIFELTDKGLIYAGKSSEKSKSALSAAVSTARGGSTPPQQQVGFGSKK